MKRAGTPAFTGLALHRDRDWRFEFWYPIKWQRFNLGEGRTGVVYAPTSDGVATSFSIEARNVGTEVKGEDMAVLHAGFLEGLASLPGCQIETEKQWKAAALIGLEAKYTFREAGTTRKRWVRLLYEGTRQFHVVAQGATPDEYDYWLPMLFEMMMTLRIN